MDKKVPICRHFPQSTRLSTPVERQWGHTPRPDPLLAFFAARACGQPGAHGSVYTGPGRPPGRPFFLPRLLYAMKRTYQPNVRRRKRKHGFRARMATRAGRDDPEAPPREGPQAALGVAVVPPVQRNHRLSRSRDFDAVYRHGRSVSTRFLVLYWFARTEEPRRPAARPRRAEGGRRRGRPQPDQAAAARDLARAPRARPAPATTTCSSSARGSPRRPRRAATTGSSSASTRCSGRRPRDVPRRSASSCTRFFPLARASPAPPTCKYHPTCSAVRA